MGKTISIKNATRIPMTMNNHVLKRKKFIMLLSNCDVVFIVSNLREISITK
jgi:hypothetical protein